jgi:hypothetical protein
MTESLSNVTETDKHCFIGAIPFNAIGGFILALIFKAKLLPVRLLNFFAMIGKV